MFDKQILSIEGIKPFFVFSALDSFIRVILILIQCSALSRAIVLVWSGYSFESAIVFVSIFAASYLLRQCIKLVSEHIVENKSYAVADCLRTKLLSHMWDTTLSLTNAFGSTCIANMLSSGIDSIAVYIRTYIPKLIQLVVIPISIVIFILTQDVISAVILIVCYPCIIAFMYLVGHSAKDESAKRLCSFNNMSNFFVDALRGMSTLKAYLLSKNYGTKVYATSEAFRKNVMLTLKIATLSSAVLDIFSTCGLAAVAIMLGFRLVEGSIGFYPALVTLMLTPEFFAPIKHFAADYHETLEGKSQLSSLQNMLSSNSRKVNINPKHLDIQEGDHVAVVGPSGSGKTTLLSAIAGVQDAACGSSPFDASRIAYIPQRCHILNASLRENVAFYNPAATDEDIVASLMSVGLDVNSPDFPLGLHTLLGEEGRGLSGGQAQRIVLARAIVDPSRDVWLLDEPTSNLDAWTDAEVRDVVFKLANNKTLVVATHKSSWIQPHMRVINLCGLAYAE